VDDIYSSDRMSRAVSKPDRRRRSGTTTLQDPPLLIALIRPRCAYAITPVRCDVAVTVCGALFSSVFWCSGGVPGLFRCAADVACEICIAQYGVSNGQTQPSGIPYVKMSAAKQGRRIR